MHNEQPLWTRNFLLICLANLAIFTSFYFLLPTLPVFVTDFLGGDPGNVGYIIGILSLTAVLVRPLSGYLLDALGRKKILILAVAAFALAMAAYIPVAGLAALLILRGLHGIAWGFTTTAAGTVAADVVPPSRRGEGMGYYGLSNTLAMAAGPSLGLFILNSAGFTVLFTASLAAALAGLAFSLGISYRENRLPAAAEISLESLFEPKVFSLSGVMFFIAVGYGGIVSFITLYGKELGIKNAGTYFLVYALTLLVVRPAAGRLFDRKGPAGIMAAGFASILLAFVILFLAGGIGPFLLSAVAMGIGFGTVQPSAMAMAINRVAPHRRGAANGTIMSSFDLGIGLGSIILGAISNSAGLSNMYLSCSLFVIAAAAIFFLMALRQPAAGAE
ncbi:MAG: MFS transporter [Bacillota bacterium]